MTSFLNGPAQGKTLQLKRSPHFLRVVEANGKWDALDKLSDKPEKHETLYAYEITGTAGQVHIYGTKISGWYSLANYKFIASQPTDAQMRDAATWRQWCMDNAPKKP